MQDLLIIGGGIAGLTLALACRDRGLRATVFEDPAKPSAAHAAGGILNPITGKSFSLAWNASALFPCAAAFYSRWGAALSTPFFTARPIYRLTSAQRARKLERRLSADPAAAQFIAPSLSPPPPFAATGPREQPLALLHVTGGGTLDTRRYLNAVRQMLEQEGNYIRASVDPRSVEVSAQGASILGRRARFAVFCEGRHAADNPLFPHLQLDPVKGDLLTLRLPSLTLDNGIYIQAHWLFQSSPGIFQFGATYAPGEIDETPGTDAANRLLAALRNLFPPEALEGMEILEHRSGLRPGTADRLPYLDRHPDYPALAALTGLGSKGCSLAPWMSAQLLDHWFEGRPLIGDLRFSRAS